MQRLFLHVRALAPLASPSQGEAWQALHGLVGCVCALLSLSHFVGDLPQKVS